MVKIYRPVNETWIISNESLQGLINRTNEKSHVTKFGIIFQNVIYNFRLGFSGREFYMDFSLFGAKTSANVSVYFKNGDEKRYFKNINSRSELIYFPCTLFLDQIVDRICEIQIKGMFVIERDEYPDFIPRINCLNDLLREKCDDKCFDIIVFDKNGNESTIKVNKQVLLSQSPVFEGMFRSGMKESISNTLKIIDFEYTTIKAAVEYFYGQEFSNFLNFFDLFEILRFADKYLIDNLIEYITTLILYQISPSNVCEIYNYAIASNSASSTKILQFCYEFLVVCLNESIPVENFDTLDKELTENLL